MNVSTVLGFLSFLSVFTVIPVGERKNVLGLTLSAAHQFSQAYPDTYLPENGDFFRPDYRYLYRSMIPQYFAWTLSWLGITFEKSWEKPFIGCGGYALLQKVTQDRQSLVTSRGSVAQIFPVPGEKIVLFGDLQGAFGSFVRSLSELERLGIIDNDLRVIKQEYKIVLNANFLGRGPQALPTLLLVAALLHQNPEHVFVIRGSYEEVDLFNSYGLGQYWRLMGNLCGTADLSYKSLAANFLSSLPSALYINYNRGKELIRFSSYPRTYQGIKEQLMGDFFQRDPSESVVWYNLAKKVKTTGEVHVRVLFRSLDGIDEFQPDNKGLALLGYAGGAIEWTAFSSPLPMHQKFNNFFYDAFSIISLEKEPEQSTISLYNHDSRRREETWSLVARYNLFSGEQLEHSEEFTKKIGNQKLQEEVEKPIVIASIADLSKGASIRGLALKQGMTASVTEANRHGGIKGRPIEFVVRDDENTPNKTREILESLLSVNHPDFITLSQGSPTLRASLDLIENNSTSIFFPSTGSSRFRTLALPGLIHFRATYEDQLYAVIPYLVDKKKIERFTFFYELGEYGNSALAIVRALLPQLGIHTWSEVGYARNMVGTQVLADKIKETQPEALGLFSSSLVTKDLVRELGAEVLGVVKLFGLDPLYDGLFDTFIREAGMSCIFCRILPDAATSKLPIVEDYRTAMKREGAAYTDPSLEGYVGMSLLIHALRTVPAPLTRQTVMAFFEKMKNYNYKGLTLTFNPQTRDLMHTVWLDLGDGTVLQVVDPKEQFLRQHGKQAQQKAVTKPVVPATTVQSQKPFGAVGTSAVSQLK